MARQYSRSSTDPAVIITQAFCFLDGQSVPEPSGGFLTHNLAVDLVFESGLSELYVGGTSPDLDDPDYRNLKASMDNLRVWWPSCPDANDPTKCNPYGFLYPQMIDGFRSPSTGIRDDEVSLSHVAPVIQNNMFQVAASDEPGLLVQLTFDNGITEGVVRTTSTWNGPDVCLDTGYPVCDGCIPECIFSNCGIFDTDCVEAGASDPATQAKYAESGTCQCLNVNDCPRQVEGCQCPQDKGLHKVCTQCASLSTASQRMLVRCAVLVRSKEEASKKIAIHVILTMIGVREGRSSVWASGISIGPQTESLDGLKQHHALKCIAAIRCVLIVQTKALASRHDPSDLVLRSLCSCISNAAIPCLQGYLDTR